MAVCDRLELLALQTHDEELEKRADRLREQAQRVYNQKTRNLVSVKLPPDADEPRADRRDAKQVVKQEGKR